MPKKWIILQIALVAVMLTVPLLTACGGDKTTTTAKTTTTTTTTTSSAPTKEVKYKIGLSATVQGATAESRDFSLDTGIADLNKAGGVTIGDTHVTFENSFQDDQGNSAGLVTAIQKLLYDYGAQTIVHQGGFVPATVVRSYTEEEKVLFFSREAPEVWLGTQYPYSFRLNHETPSDLMKVMAMVAKYQPNIKTVRGLMTMFNASADVYLKAVEKAAKPEWGIDYLGTTWYEYTTTDFFPALTDLLKGTPPDAICIPYWGANSIIPQARQMGYKGTFITFGAIPDYMLTSGKPADLEGTASFSPDLNSTLVPQWVRDYRASYFAAKKTYPYSIEVEYAYIMPFYLAAAIKAAGSTDNTKLKQVMETQKLTVQFPTGETMDIQMSGAELYGINHAYYPPKYFSVIENGKPVIKEVIPGSGPNDKYRALYLKYK